MLPSTDFRAEISDREGQRYGLFVSPGRDRFRIEGGDWAVIGPLFSKDWAFQLDPVERSYFHFRADRERELRRAGGRLAESRYRDALGGEVGRAFGLAGFPLASPCDRAEEELQQHGGCRVERLDDGTQRWHHEVTHRGSLYDGFKKHVQSTRHDVEPQLGLLVRSEHATDHGTGRGQHVSSLETVDLDPALFDVPSHYREALSDEELLATTRAAVGWESMLPGCTLFQRSASAADDESGDATFQVLREAWMRRASAGQDAIVVEIASARTNDTFDFEYTPFEVNWQLAVDGWDATADVGEQSLRVDERTILFVAADTLLRVRVFPATLANELVPLCERIVARLEE